MSIHPSLKLSSKGRRHRSVLKRIERLKYLYQRGKFSEGDSVFGLSKIKNIKIKIKKEKAVKETAAAPAEAAAGTTTAPTKETTPTKSKEEAK